MRVPSVGLTPDERRIVEEGYRYARKMLEGYRDPPGPIEIATTWLANCRRSVLAFFQTMLRQ